jgi:hypothetical protein
VPNGCGQSVEWIVLRGEQTGGSGEAGCQEEIAALEHWIGVPADSDGRETRSANWEIARPNPDWQTVSPGGVLKCQAAESGR